MSYRLIDSNNRVFYTDRYITQNTANELPCIYADLPNGLDKGHYLAIPTHEGMTNGDMIKALFPSASETDHFILNSPIGNILYVRLEEYQEMRVQEDWWNAPYKESEE